MDDSPPLDDLDGAPGKNLRPARATPLQPPGHRAALEALYRSHFGKLVGFFRHCGQSEAVAQDLAQDSFSQALRHLHQFDGRAQLSTWVWAIGRNQLLGHLRKPASRLQLVTEPAEPIDPDSLRSRQSGRLMEQCECVRRGFAAFAKLHPERAEVMYLAAVEGWTREELAQHLGRTVHAATEYLSQCRAKLRPFIEGCDDSR